MVSLLNKCPNLKSLVIFETVNSPSQLRDTLIVQIKPEILSQLHTIKVKQIGHNSDWACLLTEQFIVYLTHFCHNLQHFEWFIPHLLELNEDHLVQFVQANLNLLSFHLGFKKLIITDKLLNAIHENCPKFHTLISSCCDLISFHAVAQLVNKNTQEIKLHNNRFNFTYVYKDNKKRLFLEYFNEPNLSYDLLQFFAKHTEFTIIAISNTPHVNDSILIGIANNNHYLKSLKLVNVGFHYTIYSLQQILTKCTQLTELTITACSHITNTQLVDLFSIPCIHLKELKIHHHDTLDYQTVCEIIDVLSADNNTLKTVSFAFCPLITSIEVKLLRRRFTNIVFDF
jgi:hypothetical protein